MTDGALIGARVALMIDLALLMGLPLFWWVMDMTGRAMLVAMLALLGIALSALWLLASAAAMTGAPISAPDWATARILLTMTPIGSMLAVRAAALMLALVSLALPHRRRLVLIPVAIAAATLAWTGHASATEGVAGTVHRIADVVHIWAASAWIGALAVLFHAVLTLRASRDHRRQIGIMLARFSLMGTLIVATLAISGAVNSVMIVGLTSPPALMQGRYGLLLGGKLALFGLMLGLAALNRWRLTPALESGGSPPAIARLRLSLLIETGAAIAILFLVGWLGTLDPLAS